MGSGPGSVTPKEVPTNVSPKVSTQGCPTTPLLVGLRRSLGFDAYRLESLNVAARWFPNPAPGGPFGECLRRAVRASRPAVSRCCGQPRLSTLLYELLLDPSTPGIALPKASSGPEPFAYPRLREIVDLVSNGYGGQAVKLARRRANRIHALLVGDIHPALASVSAGRCDQVVL